MRINSALKKEVKKIILAKISGEEKKKALIITPYQLKQEDYLRFYESFPFLKEKEIQNITDETLLGGFILRCNSIIIDASIGGKINKLTAGLYENN